MKNIVGLVLFFQINLLCSSGICDEYQKMFACAQSLKTDAQVATTEISKNLVALPVKIRNSEGINLFVSSGIYFCRLPKKFISKSADEKLYEMNLSVPKQKPIYVSYLKSTTEPATLEVMNWNDNINFTQNQLDFKKEKITFCSPTSDPHSQKIFADFLRKQISLVHEKFNVDSETNMASQLSVESLKLCGKAYLLKTIAENELKKFEPRMPAAAAPEERPEN